jgi:hypothetical protein
MEEVQRVREAILKGQSIFTKAILKGQSIFTNSQVDFMQPSWVKMARQPWARSSRRRPNPVVSPQML